MAKAKGPSQPQGREVDTEGQTKLPRLSPGSRVAKPQLDRLTSAARRSATFRSASKQHQEIFLQATRRALQFMARAPVFKTSASLQELEARPKNTPEAICAAQAAIDLLEARPTRHSSTRWVDRNGIPIACYLSSRLRADSLEEGEDGGEMVIDDEREDGCESQIEINDEGDGDGEVEIDDDGESEVEIEIEIDDGKDRHQGTFEDPDTNALKRSKPIEEQRRLSERAEDFLPTNEDKLFRDGLLPQTTQRMLEVTQMLSSFCQPTFNSRD
ncbi:hypothetical protein BDR06DRAFT_1015767, partial [Suillus hirtellus]